MSHIEDKCSGPPNDVLFSFYKGKIISLEYSLNEASTKIVLLEDAMQALKKDNAELRLAKTEGNI